MHRCLLIAEIVRVIADKLGEAEVWGNHRALARRDLCSMALTCRAFFDPAMDALWEESTVPFSCLPAHVTAGKKRFYDLITSPTEAEWRRFEQYARRVKSLRLHITPVSSDCIRITSAWKSFKEFYPGNAPLPNLRHFHCDTDRFKELYSFAFPAALKTITLFNFKMNTAEYFREAVKICEKSLERLEITLFNVTHSFGGPENDNLVYTVPVLERMSPDFANMMSLQVLNIPYVPPTALAHLASLPKLKSLSTYLRGDISYTQDATVQHSFPALRDLTLILPSNFPSNTIEMSPLLSFLTASRFPCLMSLVIRPCHDSPWKKIDSHMASALFNAVSKIESIRTFKCLDLHNSPFTHVFGLSILSILFSLPDIEALEIDAVVFDITSCDISTIVRAWPKIRSLIIGIHNSYMDSPGHPGLVPENLQLFAESCPNLEKLGLPLNFDAHPPQVPPYLPPVQSQSPLRELHFGGYSARYSLGISAFIASVFPRATVYQVRRRYRMGDDDTRQAQMINAKIRDILRDLEEGKSTSVELAVRAEADAAGVAKKSRKNARGNTMRGSTARRSAIYYSDD